MATKLFLRNTQTHGITGTGDGILYDMLTAAGAASDTAVTNTSASGTEIQATKTAGGSSIAWISGRAPSGGFTLTSADISLWQLESNMNANIGGRFRVFKRAANGTITEIGGGPFDDGVEMSTSDREDTWTSNVTDTAFAEDDRILLRYYLTNVGTMASGHTGTLTFNAADASTGDSFFNIAETVTFKAEGSEVALTGSSTTASAGNLTPMPSVALTGAAITGTVGALTPRIENIKVRDEFVDTDGTNATAHTADVGGPWTGHPANQADSFIHTNRLTKDSNSGQSLLIANATVSGDGYVETTLRMLTSISVNAGIAISVHPTNDDYVYARHNRDGGEYSIRSVVSGSATAIGTATETLVANDERVMRLERRTVAGPHDEYRLLVGGVQIIPATPGTWVQSDGHTGTRVGLRFGGAASSTTGYALERFEAGEFVVPSPDVTVAITGVSTTAAAGNVSVASSDVTLALTGVSATAAVGSVTPSGGLPALRVCNLNVQHGDGTDLVRDFARQVNAMTPGVDIVCMQERSTGDTGWDAGMAAAGFDEVVYRENGHGTDGPSIWVRTSRVTVNGSPFDHALSTGAIGWDGSTNVDKAAVGAHVTVAGISFYVFNTHLAWSAGADSDGSTFSAIRVAQINELMSWIDSIVGGDPNVLIVGDMNFGPDYPVTGGGLQIDLILDEGYSDLWVQGIAESKATAPWNDRDSVGGADMPITSLTTRTHDTRRIDYYFLRDNAQMLFTAIDLPDLRANCSGALTGSPLRCPDVDASQLTGTEDDYGVKPSDHNLMNLTLALSPDVTRALTGSTATASAGNLAVSRAQSLAGSEATAQAGSPSVARSHALTGEQITSAGGSVTLASGDVTLALTGQSMTAASGTLSVERTAGLTGVSLSLAVGNLAPSHSKALTGNGAALSIGSLAVDFALALTGIASVGAPGTVNISTTVPLTGNASIISPGALSFAGDPNVTIGLSGVAVSLAAGNLSPAHSKPITGGEATAAAGDVDASLSVSLPGQSITTEAGEVEPQTATTLTGAASGAQPGSLASAHTVVVNGAETEAEAGTVGPGHGLALQGEQAAGEIGNLAASFSIVIEGAEINGQPGALIVARSVTLDGEQMIAEAGFIVIPKRGARVIGSQRGVTFTTSGRTSAEVKNER